jgi:hypothetical protein
MIARTADASRARHALRRGRVREGRPSSRRERSGTENRPRLPHGSVDTTAGIYVHSTVEDLRSELERAGWRPELGTGA